MPTRGLFKFRVISTDQKRLEKLSEPAKTQYFNELTEEHARGLAEYARQRMSAVLKKSHKFNVGASDTASENLYVPSSPDISRDGYVEYAVYEGSATKANFFIRRGFAGTSGTKQIPRQNLKEWAASKQITLRERPDKSKGGKPKTAKYYWRTNKYGTTFTQSTKRNPAENAIEKIAKYLERHGSRYSNWVNLTPEGQGRFDYPYYVANQTKGFKKQMKDIGDSTLAALANYIASGKLASGQYPRTGRTYKP